MDDLVAAIRDVVAHISPGERVILCGESFGGALSLSYAKAHPETLRGLVILNSFARVRQRLGLRFGPPLLRLVPWGAMGIVRRFTGSRLHTSTTNEEDLRQFAERSRAIGKTGYIRRLEILRDYDLRGDLQKIETPTLFLAAEEDHLVDAVPEARFMASRMPRAEVRTLPGFGHICLIHHDFDLASTNRALARAVVVRTRWRGRWELIRIGVFP